MFKCCIINMHVFLFGFVVVGKIDVLYGQSYYLGTIIL